MTSFHVAAERGRCEEILGHLLQQCDNINIEDDEGVSYPISQYSSIAEVVFEFEGIVVREHFFPLSMCYIPI